MNKKKIMIAEDDTGILDAMQMILEDAGYDVVTNEGEGTVSSIEREQPDLLLLDIWLSGINGKDVCVELKKQNSTKHIPVIMCSANRDTEQISREAGADDFLAKPFEMDDLLQKVERYAISS